MFNCEKCEKEFPSAFLLNRHNSGKLPCNTPEKIKNIKINKVKKIDKNINKLNDKLLLYDNKINKYKDKIDKYINNSIENLYCTNCGKKYANKQTIQRHFNQICDKIKTLRLDKNKIIQEKNDLLQEINKLNEQKNKLVADNENNELKDEIKKIREDMKKLLEKQFIQNTQNITIHKNITNNNNNNNNMTININSFGKESLDHITLDNYKKYLNGFFPGFVNFIEKIHFDETAPQNHNLCITNLKSKFICVYDNGKWIVKDKDDIIDNLITKKYNLLGEKCEEFEETKQISEKTIKNFEEFCENYDSIEAQKTTKNNITLMIYNNGDKLINKPKYLEKTKKNNKIIEDY
jgi:hypothetical protein